MQCQMIVFIGKLGNWAQLLSIKNSFLTLTEPKLIKDGVLE